MYILNFAFSALQHKDKNDLTPERLGMPGEYRASVCADYVAMFRFSA
jgi:hypothetical protein